MDGVSGSIQSLVIMISIITYYNEYDFSVCLFFRVFLLLLLWPIPKVWPIQLCVMKVTDWFSLDVWSCASKTIQLKLLLSYMHSYECARCRMFGKSVTVSRAKEITETQHQLTLTPTFYFTNKLKFYWHFPRVIYGARFNLLTHSFAIHVCASNIFWWIVMWNFIYKINSEDVYEWLWNKIK